MRILKYIFLLLLLIFFAAAVFTATQKGTFDITRSKVIKSKRAIVFNYVNDYSNWQDWISWANAGTDFKFSTVASGKGASFSWDGSDNDGSMQTVFTKENDSISQKMELNGMPGTAFWKFKDTVGGTKVTWRVKGTMGFMPKIRAVLNGGPERVLGAMYEQSLFKLDKTLDYEINTFAIKVDGIFLKPGNFYLKQSIVSTFANMPKNMRIMMSKLAYFFQKNKIPMAGKPFVIYDYYDKANGIAKFSVGIPVAEEVFTSPGSDISSGKTEAFRAVKTTLTGDYSHLREAWDKTRAYIKKNNLSENTGMKPLELYKSGRADSKGPSKWVTEIYIPIMNSAAAAAPGAKPANPAAATPAKPKPETPTDEISIP